MRQDLVTYARMGGPAWAWWRDAAALAVVWLQALLRLGGVISFFVGVLALLIVKSVVRTFGHTS